MQSCSVYAPPRVPSLASPRSRADLPSFLAQHTGSLLRDRPASSGIPACTTPLLRAAQALPIPALLRLSSASNLLPSNRRRAAPRAEVSDLLGIPAQTKTRIPPLAPLR